MSFALLSVSTEAQSPLEDLGVRTLPTSAVPAGRVAARFMGTSTILLDDGTTQILIDGFFTRPGLFQMAQLRPSSAAIQAAMTRAGIGNRLRAVLVAHSHYDHALDAPTIAERTGARLVGSASTANIGRGAGLPDSQIDIIQGGEERDYGDFHVTIFRSPHSPSLPFPGEISRPLTPPAPVGSYREGGSYSFLVTHHGFSILINPSANVRKWQYQGVQADVVFLGIGMLGKQSGNFQWKVWRTAVRDTGARLVIPIHWDDFMKPLDEGLQFPSKLVDDVPGTIKTLRSLSMHTRRTRLRAMPLFDPVDIEAAAAP